MRGCSSTRKEGGSSRFRVNGMGSFCRPWTRFSSVSSHNAPSKQPLVIILYVAADYLRYQVCSCATDLKLWIQIRYHLQPVNDPATHAISGPLPNEAIFNVWLVLLGSFQGHKDGVSWRYL